MTQPDNAWAPPVSDADAEADVHTAWGAIAALGLCSLALLLVVSSFSQFDAFDPFGATSGTEKLQVLARYASGTAVPLGLALGLLAIGFVLSDRESLAPLERTSLLVLTGLSAAFALLVAVAVVSDLTSDEQGGPNLRPFAGSEHDLDRNDVS